MPERAQPKVAPHPWIASGASSGTGLGGASRPRRRSAGPAYAELHVTSNFTFLTGASHPDELVARAAELGHCAAAIADKNTLAGVVRAHVAAKEIGIPLAVGCRLAFAPEEAAPEILVYPESRAGYARLCRLLTAGKRRAPKGECRLALAELLEHAQDLLAVVLPPRADGLASARDELERFEASVLELRACFGERLSLAAAAHLGPDDRSSLARVAEIARRAEVPLAATNDVHYHDRGRRALQDALVCVREGCTLERAGFRLFPNAERCLKPAREMAHLFAEHPKALARAAEIAERASAFRLDELRYQYPSEVVPAGRTAMQHLTELAWSGASSRYPRGVPAKVRRQIEHELALIDELAYAPYFLTVHELVLFARSRGILCQGRGAAANSAVCYCLGVTAVDPDRIDVLFERFVSRERNEPPDIDIDFEHERREEVIQHIYAKYGRDRAALTAEVISYRGRSAIRDVGKALGFSLESVGRLAKEVDWWSDALGEEQGSEIECLRELGLDPASPAVRRLVRLANEVRGFPRHLSQHVGGFVITEGLLSELVPIENAAMQERTVIEWDKDDIDALGILKVDCLGLGMLTCVRKAFELVNARGGPRVEFDTVPPEDRAVYEMISAADTVGVFQVESRAQMSMLPRLKPREFYDLVIEVAIVRPGPIQGNMVHPYLRRRRGEEPVSYPSDAVRAVLAKTLGVPLFQEQAMALAIVAAGFTPGEADQLRRAMAAWKRKSDRLEALGKKLMQGLVKNGYTPDFAERLYSQILGFGEYGFPESHAASFALIVYVSAWLKRHHPAAFAAALINSQPMGFYAPAQIVRDAREHGVLVLPVDVNKSGWDCRLEDVEPPGAHGGPALRLGMRLVKGLGQADADAIAAAVLAHGPFADVASLRRASGASARALRRLAYADAFTSLGLDRQRALWEVRALRDEKSALWDAQAVAESPAAAAAPRLPAVAPLQRVLHDYAATTLSLKAHPMAFARAALDELGVIPAALLRDGERFPNGAPASTAGIVLVRQRPGTAKGIVFMTLEDETGTSNLIVRPEIYERDRRAARHAVALLAHGKIERADGVVHLMASRIESLDGDVRGPAPASRDFH